MSGERGAWRRVGVAAGSVRARTTGAAVLVVGLALVVGAIALVVLLGRSLTSQVRTTAETRAGEIASELAAGQAPELSSGETDEEFVQVLDERGDVVASSSNVEGEAALARPEPGTATRVDYVPFDEGAFLAVGASAMEDGKPRTVVVGRGLDDVREAAAATARLLALGVPLLMLLVGLVTWWIVGRALHPVDAIREEVEAISASRLDRRVPESATGDEIARLSTTMNRMLERLQRSQERQRRFVSDASHELRSPVASIRQHAEVARAHPESSGVGELASAVLDEDERLQRLVDDLLLLARMDEGGTGARSHESVDMDDLVLRETERMRASSIVVDGSGVGAGRVSGDPSQLQRLVRNLSENAERHAHSTVAVGVREQDGWVLVTVEDDGDGVPPTERDRIFERFVRLDGARDRASGGSGLGLAIVREVAVAHGGSVRVDEGTLGGARFEVRLPRAQD